MSIDGRNIDIGAVDLRMSLYQRHRRFSRRSISRIRRSARASPTTAGETEPEPACRVQAAGARTTRYELLAAVDAKSRSRLGNARIRKCSPQFRRNTHQRWPASTTVFFVNLLRLRYAEERRVFWPALEPAAARRFVDRLRQRTADVGGQSKCPGWLRDRFGDVQMSTIFLPNEVSLAEAREIVECFPEADVWKSGRGLTEKSR